MAGFHLSGRRCPIRRGICQHCLLKDHNIPEEQIKIATGSQWELDDVDLASPACKVRYIITVQALREGWDCPFAYVLCSVAEMRSSTAVEQILGRVMRLPGARRKVRAEFNMAYAFAASENFGEAAKALTDALVESGFERQEAKDLITQAPPPPIADLPLFAPPATTVTLYEIPDFSKLSKVLAERLTFNAGTQELTITGVLGEQDRESLRAAMTTDSGQAAIERAYRLSRGHIVTDSSSPAERGEIFTIPVLAIRQDDLTGLDSHRPRRNPGRVRFSIRPAGRPAS